MLKETLWADKNNDKFKFVAMGSERGLALFVSMRVSVGVGLAQILLAVLLVSSRVLAVAVAAAEDLAATADLHGGAADVPIG